jgi:hypothetical protein
VGSTLQLPAIFLWEEKLVAPLIATPNVRGCIDKKLEKNFSKLKF